MEWTIRLFSEGRFEHCIADCRTMLLYENLPFLYRIYCRALITGEPRRTDSALQPATTTITVVLMVLPCLPITFTTKILPSTPPPITM
jgi:hypothetical protein